MQECIHEVHKLCGQQGAAFVAMVKCFSCDVLLLTRTHSPRPSNTVSYTKTKGCEITLYNIRYYPKCISVQDVNKEYV